MFVFQSQVVLCVFCGARRRIFTRSLSRICFRARSVGCERSRNIKPPFASAFHFRHKTRPFAPSITGGNIWPLAYSFYCVYKSVDAQYIYDRFMLPTAVNILSLIDKYTELMDSELKNNTATAARRGRGERWVMRQRWTAGLRAFAYEDGFHFSFRISFCVN